MFGMGTGFKPPPWSPENLAANARYSTKGMKINNLNIVWCYLQKVDEVNLKLAKIYAQQVHVNELTQNNQTISIS